MTLSEYGRACLVAIIASSAGFALPIQAGDQQPAVTLAAAKEAVVSARSVLRRGFDSNRQRAIAWSADGNLWVASEPDFSPRILSARDQQGSITQIYPSGDGQSFFFVREQGSSPGTKELLQVAIDKTGSAKRVDSGADIPTQLSFAPSGDAVAFADGTMLYEYRLTTDGQWQRRSLLDASDPRNTAAIGLSDIAYSADGSQLAWVSQRKAQQRYVAVHDIAKGETRYLDPGVFVDLSPVWSPDGSEVAFIRWPTNLVMNYRFSSGREGVPWSIVAANVKTGAARTVWKADAGPGSLPAGFDLIWAPSGEILFRWEKTGWNLLYAVPASGGAARLLTPGEGEVLSQPALSADGRSVVYSANIGDLMRPHLWSVALAGGAPKQLTSGNGVELSPRLSAGGYLSYVSDNRDHDAPQVMIRSPKGDVRPLLSLNPRLAKRNQAMWQRFVPSQTIAVRTADGLTGHHVVIEPATPAPPGGYPVIVNAHGGPASVVRPGGEYAFAFGQYAASRGYLFVDINYRGSASFGLNYRLPDGQGAMGASEVNDLIALVRYLKSRGDVNAKRVGVMGGSYGGHIVGLAMSRLPDDFAAGVSLFGVADWVVERKKDQEEEGDSRDPMHYLRLSERARIEDLAFASSPSAHIERWRGPTLFTIGDLDKNGHVESVTDLSYRLLERGVPVEIYVDPAGGHNVFPQQRVFEFFERYLNNVR